MSLKIYYYSAEWCGPCKKFGPALTHQCELRGIPVVKRDVDADSVTHSIQSVPTVIVERDGEMVDRFGAISAWSLAEKLDALT